MHTICKIPGMHNSKLYFDVIYMGLSYSGNSFLILREFPSYEVAQGLILKPKSQGIIDIQLIRNNY